jgi:hypothetical protein
MAPHLTDVREPVEARDLALALDPGRVARWQVTDQRSYPLTQLESEVGGRGAHQLADVVDRDLSARPQTIWMLGLAHRLGPCEEELTGWGSRSASTFA